MRSTKVSDGKSMKGMKWIVVLLAVFLIAGAFVGVAGATPTASFTATPGSGADSLKVTFDASESSGEGSLDYSWNIGDDTASGVTASHTFSTPGTYTVTLTVTDQSTESDTETKSIIVTQAEKTKIDAISVTLTKPVGGSSPGNVTLGGTYASHISPGTVSWNPTLGTDNKFAYGTSYTATIPVTVKSESQATHEFASQITVTGASGSTSATYSNNEITVVYPATEAAEKTKIDAISVTLTKPVGGSSPGNVTLGGTYASHISPGTVSWNPTLGTDNKFAYGTSYTATIPVTVKSESQATHELATNIEVTKPADATSANYANGSITVVYSATEAQTQEIQSITVSGITAPVFGANITSQTVAVSATNPANHTADVTPSDFKWKKGSNEVSSGTFSVGTYVAEFTLTPAAGVTIKDGATVSDGTKNGTYSSSTKKATISYTLGEISSIDVSLSAAPAGGSAAPTITLRDTTNLKMGNSGVTWYEGYTSTTPLTSTTTLKYNTEYKAVFTVLINNEDTQKFATTVSITSTPSCLQSGSAAVKDSDEPDRKVTVTLKFKTAVDKEIDAVSLTMNSPVAGGTASTSTSQVTPETSANYTVESLKWYLDSTELATAYKFESGKKYTAKITLETKEDYVFNSSITKSSVKVNTKAVDKITLSTDKKTLTLDYTFSETSKPVISLTINPASPKIGIGQSSVLVQFNYSITGEYTTASINFGDGSSAATLSSKSGTTAHTYTGTNSYTATLSVKDASGVVLSSKTLGFTVGKDTLTAGFTATPAGDNPQKISFAGTTAGNVTKWEWDLGDGTKTNEKSFTHIYKKAKDYTVTLTVYSGGLSDTTTKTVTVAKGSSAGDNEPFLIIGDTEVPSPLAIIAEFIRLIQSLFDFENHPLFPGNGE